MSHDSLDTTWLALVAEGLDVNIMVWEPSGVGQEVQPYNAGSIKDLFLGGKGDRVDQAGEHWVHLLYRASADPWGARAGVSTGGDHSSQDHFDRLHLGGDAADSFTGTIAQAQQQLQHAEAPATVEGRASAGAPEPPRQRSIKIDLGGRDELQPIGAPAGEKRRKVVIVEGKRGGGVAATSKRGQTNKKATRAPRDESSGEKEAEYGSDGTIGNGGVDHLKTEGAFASLTGNKKQLNTRVELIAEGRYKEAFLLSSKRVALGYEVSRVCGARVWPWSF